MRSTRWMGMVAVTMAAGLLLAACGSGALTVAKVKSNGKLVWCSDITYPPEEFYQGSTPAGSDIEIGQAIAKSIGVTAEFDNTGFDGIIPALLAKKCDVIISGMNDNPERRKQVDFVDYLSVGQSFMVQKGNPAGIQGIPDLAGKTVSVEVGTTNAAYLKTQSDKLAAGGSQGFTIQPFPKDTDAANALKTGKVDAYFGDAPVVAYYIAQDPTAFDFGGAAVNPISVGIAVRKADTDLKAAVQSAVTTMYSSGQMCTILAKWKMTPTALGGKC